MPENVAPWAYGGLIGLCLGCVLTWTALSLVRAACGG